MKQKRSRGLFEKAENASVRNTPAQRGKHTLPEGAFRKRFEGKEREAAGRSHPSGSNSNRARRRPKAAVVAGVDPRRGRVIGWYLRVQGVLLRRWVVDLAVGEHHVDGDLISGGRWFGRGWNSPVGAANSKLVRGLERWMH